MKILISSVLSAVVAGGAVAFFMSQDTSTASNTGDKNDLSGIYEYTKTDFSDEFIEDSGAFIYLLEDNLRKSYDDKMTALNEDETANKEVTALTLNYIFEKEPEIKKMFVDLDSSIQAKKSDENYFEKSTACAGLTTNIKSNIVNSEKTYSGTVNRELEYVFYSPTLDTCTYTVHRKITDSDTYDSIHHKDVFNANTQSQLNSYRIYSSDDWDDESEAKKSDTGTKAYIKYILENSNYNADLLRDTEFIYI